MTFVVAFDGSEMARRGLIRAVELAPPTVDVLAYAVIPQKNPSWATERGLLEEGEEFELSRVAGRLEVAATEVDERVRFEFTPVDRYAPPGRISHKIRSFAHEVGATMVFVGSEDAGGIVTSLQSVGTQVASDESYDVVIVRRAERVVD